MNAVMTSARFVACLLLAAGCGGSSLTLDQYETELVAQQCDFEVRCCQTVPGVTVYTSAADCESQSASSNASPLASVKAQITAGTFRFDAAAASQCLSALASAESSCTAIVDEATVGRSCNGDIVGNVQLGAACTSSIPSQCVPGAFCGTGNTCQAELALGAACTFGTDQCVDGATCDSTGVCSAFKAAGASCTAGAGYECVSSMCDNGACATAPTTTATDFCTGSTTTSSSN